MSTNDNSNNNDKKKSHKKSDDDDEVPQFLNICSMSITEIRALANGTHQDRIQSTVPISTITKEQVLHVEPMTLWEELICMLFLGLGVPNGVFTIPVIVTIFGKLVVGNIQTTWIMFGSFILIPLMILPQPFVPSTLQSWLACQMVKYFSFRFVFESRPTTPNKPKKDDNDNDDTTIIRPQILVAPPHGVFPYGNLLSKIAWPLVTGTNFRGLASSAALRPPIFKQILRSIGVVDASRHVARKILEERYESIGISTGGVAEVFETNHDHECIVLKQGRLGLIKLAIRTGADLVPCYLFGNTKLLGCWAGEGIPGARSVLETWSRKLGFALILIHGRFGLPIPRRIPILAVAGKPIPTYHIQCEEPTQEQLESIQQLLLDEMDDIFERYKGLYGWDDKKLIIK